MKLNENFLSLNKKARSGIKFSQPVKKIIIHWIGPYLQRITTPRDWWENGTDGKGVQASAHFIVKDEDVLQSLPLDEVGWHSGDGRNYHSIGIEVCPANLEGEFSEKTIKTLRKLVLYIQTVHPTARIIERHYDGTHGKDCPRYYTPVTTLSGVDGRKPNPEGGNERWIALRNILDGVGEA